MDEISADNKIDLNTFIASGKTIGDEMNPDMNVDDTVDEKINVEMLVEADIKNKPIQNTPVVTPQISGSKKTGSFLALMAIVVVGLGIMALIAWIAIF